MRDLRPEDKGKRVSCKIMGKEVEEGKIQYEDGEYYICQNVEEGDNCDDSLGYKYSWNIYKGTTGDQLNEGVTDLKFLDRTMYNLEAGDIIVDKRCREREVLFISGKLVVTSYADIFNEGAINYQIEELIEAGYTIKQEEPKKEPVIMTIAEIEKKLGIEGLQVKKEG